MPKILAVMAALALILDPGLGSGISLVATQRRSSLLYELDPLDPWAWCGAAAILSMTGVPASIFPVMRGSRVEPTEALRQA